MRIRSVLEGEKTELHVTVGEFGIHVIIRQNRNLRKDWSSFRIYCIKFYILNFRKKWAVDCTTGRVGLKQAAPS